MLKYEPIKFEFNEFQLEIRTSLENDNWEIQAYCNSKPVLEEPYSVSVEIVRDAQSVGAIMDPVLVLIDDLKTKIEEGYIKPCCK